MSTREHTTVLELPASPEEVWRGITEAASVSTWFAPEARIDPQVGGEYWVSWGSGMEAPSAISVFEPASHLGWVYDRSLPKGAEGEIEKAPMAVDIYLEGSAGGTTLRLVNSGFLDNADWDDEYNGTKTGWPIMLRILRYGLQRSSSRGGLIIGKQQWLYQATKLPRTEAWRKFTQLVFTEFPSGLETEYVDEPSEICLPWREYGDGLVYAELGERNGQCSISLCVVLYGDAATRMDEAAVAWKQKLQGVDVSGPESG
jgi:uncharacterized protein YndB with AHSA1/START domain